MGKRSNFEEKRPKGNAWKHGHRYREDGRPSRTYRCWSSMIRRLKRPGEHPHYKGVELEESWVDFTNFLSAVGEAPSEEHTIGRIRNDRGYVKGNVRWETMAQQSRNKTSNIWVEGKILKDWCVDQGFRYKTVHAWYKKGLSWPEIKRKGEVLWANDLLMKT